MIASAKSCGFVCYTTRSAAEFAAERSFNKVIIKGKRLKVLWGRSQEERLGPKDKQDRESSKRYAAVPGLPGGECANILLLFCFVFLRTGDNFL